jgi:hypothetical protein
MASKDRSKVSNQKRYEENYDAIFRSGAPKTSNLIKDDKKVQDQLWGSVTRYRLKKTDQPQKFDDAPSIRTAKSSAESFLENR